MLHPPVKEELNGKWRYYKCRDCGQGFSNFTVRDFAIGLLILVVVLQVCFLLYPFAILYWTFQKCRERSQLWTNLNFTTR